MLNNKLLEVKISCINVNAGEPRDLVTWALEIYVNNYQFSLKIFEDLQWKISRYYSLP